ncbi:MAG: tRNA 4-thiouridine(8) synthase ThiI [Dictyoglomus turgidum]|uniref:tRNA 4-thiouridine(8) synthase ThiI n=1 Tax=Dictyoglomus turgidum TaxID=513050 RepID=UPI003C769D58
MKKARAISLISGGLDSILATWLILQQNIDVIGITFSTPFFNLERAKRACEFLNIPLHIVDITEEYMDILKNPRFGYGKNMNPCIDCHAFMVKKAKELLKEFNAEFIITGEVLGERPMSQNKQSLKLVEKYSGTEDILLRPLSAKLLPPTKPEREGLVDREKLLDIKGRSRKVQLELAKKIGLKEIPTPAGGCLLTEPNFSRRLKDLLEHNKNINRRDLELLKIGRHFRLDNNTKVIVGRNKEENEELMYLATEEDTILKAEEPSPIVIVPNKILENEKELQEIGKITAYYSDHKEEPRVKVKVKLGNREKEIEVVPYNKENFPYKPI